MLKPLTVWITTNWKILKEMGIPDHLTCLLRNQYAGQEETVKTRHGVTDWFKIGKGVQEDYILSSCLFHLYEECVRAKSLQLCPTLCDLMDHNPPGSFVHETLQARILEWVSMPSSRGSSQFRNQTHVSNVSCISRWVLVPFWKPYMQSKPCEMSSWTNHWLELRLLGEISTTSVIQMIPL